MAKEEKLDRVPPYLPLLWQDWRSSADVRGMTPAQRGIYLDILIEQWISGSVPRDAWRLSKVIHAVYDTTLRFLTNYSHLLLCSECGRSWSREDCECGASKSRATCENLKLKNLRNDVNSGLDLGTTKPNAREKEPNQTETEVSAAVSGPDPKPETGDRTPECRLVAHFIKLLGNLRKWAPKGKRWEQQVAALGDPARVTAVMDWAFAGWWASKIKTVTKVDPMTYFCEKYETMATQMDGERAEQAKAVKPGMVPKTKGQDPKYDIWTRTTKI